ncbi:MAG: hypothetical protein AB8F78_10590 [Saprospiraceae bacterium]
MKTHILLCTILCIVTASLTAQTKQYSYISDRTFASPDQLIGYDFKPAMREVPGEPPEEIPIGKYSFGITRANLYVEGPEIQGVYSVNNINTTEYGFIMKLMNARDPTIQGHLKVVVDQMGQVEGLIFKRSNKEKEVIFFLRIIPKEIAAAEAEYFTHKGEKQIKNLDSLWTGVHVRPFLRVFHNMGGVQQRILPADSVYLNFYEITTIEEKESIKEKIGKKKKKKKGKKQETIDVQETYADVAAPAAADPEAQAAARAALLAQAQGVSPDSAVVVVPVKTQEEILGNTFDNVSADTLLLSNEGETVASTDSVASDSIAILHPDSLFSMLNLAALTDTVPAVDSSKLKITTVYYVDLNSFMIYDDGSSEMQHRTYQVNGVVERENTNARPGGDRWQWELNLHKQPNAYIYLNEKFRVNSIVIDGQQFYMRGQ